MKLVIKTRLKPISVLGKFDPEELTPPPREVYLDGKRTPKGLEEIILAGLDVLGEEYLNKVEKDMKEVGWKFT